MLSKKTKKAIARRKNKTRLKNLVNYLAIVAFFIGVILVGMALIEWVNAGEYAHNIYNLLN